MINAVVRVVHNIAGYQHPSGGKLNRRAESSYAKNNGFGHEEWNFNKTLLIDGRVHGYHYYKPAENKRSFRFNLFFVTYTDGNWRIVGRYRDAQYSANGSPNSPAVNKKKVADLRALASELGSGWADLTDQQIVARLVKSEVMRWSAAPDNVDVAPDNTSVPRNLVFDRDFRKNFHESSATLISDFDARLLDKLIGKRISPTGITNLQDALPDTDAEAVEGNQKLVSHLKRE